MSDSFLMSSLIVWHVLRLKRKRCPTKTQHKRLKNFYELYDWDFKWWGNALKEVRWNSGRRDMDTYIFCRKLGKDMRSTPWQRCSIKLHISIGTKAVKTRLWRYEGGYTAELGKDILKILCVTVWAGLKVWSVWQRCLTKSRMYGSIEQLSEMAGHL